MRSVFLIMGEVAPLAPSQVAVMPTEDVVSLLERIDKIDQTKLDEGFQDLLRRFKQNLATGAGGSP